MGNETQYTTPAHNPGDNGEVGLLNFQAEQIAMKIEKVAPAEIISYDRKTNRATVQILNQSLYANGSKLTKKPIPDIPVYMMSGGGFIFSFPVKKGDKGWIIAADRNISTFKTLLTVFTPASLRKHKYEDGFFLPDYIKGINITTDDEGAVVLTSEDGTTKISIKNGQITQTAAKNIINGDLQINGSVAATGTITSDVDVISAGISGKNHTHSGVQPGSGNTGVPQ
jgi:phage baseplate assembly protein gpV